MSGSEYERGVLDNMNQGPFGDAIHGVLAGRYVMGKRDAERAALIAAFGAIRRAVEVAREHDYWKASCIRRGKKHAAEEHWHTAREIRRAIRAAIGSDKA